MGAMLAFVRRVLACTAALLILLLQPAVAGPSAEVYGHLPVYSHAQISPDGTHVAAIQGRGRFGLIAIYDVTAPGTAPVVYAPEDWMMPRNITWANNQRLLIEVEYALKGATGVGFYPYPMWRVISIDRNGGDAKTLLSDKPELRSDHGSGSIVEIDRGDPSYVLMVAPTRHAMNYTLDIFRVDPATGTSKKVEEGKSGTWGWVTDGHGDIIMREDIDGDVTRFYARLPGSSDWNEVYHYTEDTRAASGISVIGHSPNPEEVYVAGRAGNEHQSIYRFNLRTRALTPLIAADAHADLYGAIENPATGDLWGAAFDWDHLYSEFVDPAARTLYATLQSKFPGCDVGVVSATEDGSRVVAQVEGPTNPGGAYYLFDTKSGQTTKLGAKYPELSAADRTVPQFFTYQSRDGLTIPAYLTLPSGTAGKAPPLVVFPHGGPAARDDESFSYFVQFFTARGYAVFQPQFRGSEGFGRAFEDAGKFQWGLAMQDDITDGVQKLVADGRVDPARICIVGGSYGAYAALVGAMQSPQPYKCAVGLAGVYDLRLILMERFVYAQRGYTDYYYWHSIIGDTKKDGAKLDATSPALHADKISVPVLLLHGTNDLTLAVVHGQLMAKALKEAGKNYTYIELNGEDHHLSQGETRTQALREIGNFLAKYLGP
ncbi:MAG: prolyl oligopeptidase family serine peptidase [Alphaproteobacteria bacterium]|nr:prolyl oligopeptidase family serine peptidase [Alphaproteobacteria bacterium]